MARKPPRSRVIHAMTDVFARHGYEGSSLAALGSAGGLSKAGLYHHFPGGKAEMAAQVLAASGKNFTSLILGPLRTPEPAAQRFHDMLDGLDAYYRGGQTNCLMNTLALGEGLEIFGPSIKGAIAAWLAELTPTLRELGEGEPERRAHYLIAAIHGALIQTRLLDNPQIFADIIEELRRRYR